MTIQFGRRISLLREQLGLGWQVILKARSLWSLIVIYVQSPITTCIERNDSVLFRWGHTLLSIEGVDAWRILMRKSFSR